MAIISSSLASRILRIDGFPLLQSPFLFTKYRL
jgi:hypothetical protein